VESIIAAVEACMTQTDVFQAMGHKSRELAENVFSEQVIYRQIREIYNIV
jgi:cation diffusion facilitator CzcD-associated flavoprotein CzcO